MVKEMEGLEEGYAGVNGINLHYVSTGSGPLALLLHGFPEFWYSWRHQLPFLSQSFHTVAPDLRGYNTSDKPQGVSAYGTKPLVEDVCGLIRSFGQEKATLIAHDWGGVVAWNVAAFCPQMVERLVILNAPHPRAFIRELRHNRKQRTASWYVFMFQLPWFPEWYVRRNDYRMIDQIFRHWVCRKDTFSDRDVALFKQAMGQPGCLTAAINYYRAAFRDPSALIHSSSYPKIRVPTLIIWAEEDRALTLDLTRNLDPYFETPPEIRTIERCSHWVQQEQPERVNRILEEYLLS